MQAILAAEVTRIIAQKRLDQLKTAKQRNKWGQFATPPALALDIARYAWDRLQVQKSTVSFLDPAIGTGSFFGACLQAFPPGQIATATGIELDRPFAEAANEIWAAQGLQVIQGDFTRQRKEATYNLILSNPPYVRHHHLSIVEKQRLGALAETITGSKLSGLSGLYCYFLLTAHDWLADNGLAVWLIPSEFMDVNYGTVVKRYLTEQVSLIQIHRFCPADVQFDDALVSSAIVVIEKRKPEPDHHVLFTLGGLLSQPINSEQVPLAQLRDTPKWTALPQQETKLPLRSFNGNRPATVLLGDLFSVKRGLVTGNNDFFIVPRDALKQLGIPSRFTRSILPSPRYMRDEIIEADADGWPKITPQLALIDCDLSEDEISRQWPKFAEYLEEGKQAGICEGYLVSRRSPWYSQEKREPAPFVCTYMGRNRERPFRFIWNRSRATVANVYLALYPKPRIALPLAERAAEVFAALRAIHADHFFSQGRVYGGGLHKMEPSELMRLPADEIASILGVTKPDQQKCLF